MDLSIGSEIKSQSGDNFILLNKERGTHHYFYTVKCQKCGHEFVTTRITKCVCIECQKNRTRLSRIGKIYGNYKVVAYKGSTKTGNSETLRYEVECTHCKAKSIKTWDTIQRGRYGCKNCIYLHKNEYQPPSIQSVENAILSQYKHGAKSRNYERNLSKEEFLSLIRGNCFYCNAPPVKYSSDVEHNHTNRSFYRNGIDRLDSTKGYYKDNCVSCCAMCNRMKMNLPFAQFVDQIYKIKTNLDLKRSTTISKESTLQANGNGSGDPLPDNAEGEEIV